MKSEARGQACCVPTPRRYIPQRQHPIGLPDLPCLGPVHRKKKFGQKQRVLATLVSTPEDLKVVRKGQCVLNRKKREKRRKGPI